MTTRPSRRGQGLTLIEVLVAMLVMSAGLMGTLSLRLASLKANVNGHARAGAAVHAAEAFDRLRANPLRAMAGQYNLAIDAAMPTEASDIVSQDLRQWRSALASRLADGIGSLQVSATGLATVEIRWTERDNTRDSGRAMRFSFVAQL